MVSDAGSDVHDLTVPAPVARPRLALWLWERDIDFRRAGRMFGCSAATAHNICRPFGDPMRRPPKEQVLARIVAQTPFTAQDFYPPELRGPGPGDPAVLRRARAM